jgi:hypothetical protein
MTASAVITIWRVYTPADTQHRGLRYARITSAQTTCSGKSNKYAAFAFTSNKYAYTSKATHAFTSNEYRPTTTNAHSGSDNAYAHTKATHARTGDEHRPASSYAHTDKKYRPSATYAYSATKSAHASPWTISKRLRAADGSGSQSATATSYHAAPGQCPTNPTSIR